MFYHLWCKQVILTGPYSFCIYIGFCSCCLFFLFQPLNCGYCWLRLYCIILQLQLKSCVEYFQSLLRSFNNSVSLPNHSFLLLFGFVLNLCYFRFEQLCFVVQGNTIFGFGPCFLCWLKLAFNSWHSLYSFSKLVCLSFNSLCIALFLLMRFWLELSPLELYQFWLLWLTFFWLPSKFPHIALFVCLNPSNPWTHNPPPFVYSYSVLPRPLMRSKLWEFLVHFG